MKRITYYVGQTDANGQPMQAVAVQWNAVQEALLKVFGGFSLTTVLGGWKDPLSGRVSVETTVRVEVLVEEWNNALDDNTRVAAEAMAVWIKGLFEQKSVLWTIEEVEGRFV